MNSELINTLAKIQKPTITWTSTDGSKAVVLPYGGRILGLYTPGSQANLFWTHPALDSVTTAEAFYQSKEWTNSGGDRTWLSPEVDLFFPNFPVLDPYVVPSELDPGNYHLDNQGGVLHLTNKAALRIVRAKRSIDVTIDKRLEPALNPLRDLDPALASRLGYAGYTLSTRLAFADRANNTSQIGLWNLLQLPHSGDLLIPTLSKTPIQIFGGEFSADDVSATNRLIRYTMHANGQQKFGIQAATAIGRVGYMYSTESDTRLVIRNFFVNPSGDYIDVPWSDPDNPGSVIQACNVNNHLGKYSELEYHAPAIGGRTGRSSYVDESQLWAFCGKREQILSAARILISPDIYTASI